MPDSTTGPIKREDILDLVEYEKKRDEVRESAMGARKIRRVHVGDMVTVAFENVETVKYQIQEMIRAERMVLDEEIDFEIATYSGLLPTVSELSATMFIEIADPRRLREWLPRLVGIEDAVSLEIEGVRPAPAVGEPGRSREDVTSTVHYLRFPVSAEQKGALATGVSTTLLIDHPNLRERQVLPTKSVLALAADLP